MDPRQELILETIIKEHIETAQPVASGLLVEKYGLDISPATVRNDMAVLERDDYIVQPHTSAGRIPTEKAYRYYLANLKDIRLSRTDQTSLEAVLSVPNNQKYKEAAKELCRISGLAVFWAFHKHDLYYTGISNLFHQPEFLRINVIQDISGIIDRLDEILSERFDREEEGIRTLIGSESPFGVMFGSCVAKYRQGGQLGMFGILGPIRMDYQKVTSLVDYAFNKINSR